LKHSFFQINKSIFFFGYQLKLIRFLSPIQSILDIIMVRLTGQAALMHWCQDNTEGFPNVNITNFTTDWKDGLAFCALIARFRPDLM